MAQRIRSDTARANWSSLIAFVLAAVVSYLLLAPRFADLADPTPVVLVTFYVTAWPIFVAVYLVWTHLGYASAGDRQVLVASRRERATRRRWWSWLISYGGATDWTVLAGTVAVLLTVAMSQDARFRAETSYVILGFATVAASWALMVYSFALEYLRLDSTEAAEGRRHIEFSFDEPPRFGDYLTLAVLLSTMAATVSAQFTSRAAWRITRIHVLLAFAFNSVIVAMMVSVLFGGLTG